MSLSLILNESSPGVSIPQNYKPSAPTLTIDPVLPEIPSESSSAAISPSHPDHPHQYYGYAYHSPASQGAWDNDPSEREWIHGDALPVGSDISSSHRGVQEPSMGTCYKDNEGENYSRKRRKGVDDDGEYQPRQRRCAPRRYPPRTKLYHPRSPALGAELKLEECQKPAAEELRLTSSDLEDCVELWIGELSDYVLETQKRQKQVEQWFEASVLERNSMTAETISNKYAARIARIPLPPPTPPLRSHSNAHLLPLSPMAEHNGRYDSGVGFGSKDSAFGTGDDSRELDESVLGGFRDPPVRGQRCTEKRPAHAAVSDASSDLEVPSLKRTPKRRRTDNANITFEPERPFAADSHPVMGSSLLDLEWRGKRELSYDSLSGTPRAGRKKPGPKKKLEHIPSDQLDFLGLTHVLASASGDVTPTFSRPPSPAHPASLVYELNDIIPPLKKAKKVDDAAMLKRIKALEEAQRKVWTNLARRDVAKVYKYHAMGYQARQAQSERLAKLASTQARKPFTRTSKGTKDMQAKGKRLMREMLVFWKKNEREERDVRKREQKEAIDRAKVEEEKRETARQARKLEFLISQTELYSHFVGSKLKTAEVEGEADGVAPPVRVEIGNVDPDSLVDIDFDDDDPANLQRHAQYNAQEAVALAIQRAQHFDTEAALQRRTNEALQLAKGRTVPVEDTNNSPKPAPAPVVDFDSDELNFQNPTSLSGQLTIKQPRMLMAQLKEYQLKGLNWLATLYEQGINGILADEMGLGKTVQSISLLAYLAETHDIWGPFLVVAPASTLHNWQQELTRFVPTLKALPYWGNVKDRTTLRKFWSKKEISYNQDAPFHVLITSYQLAIQDQQYFQRVKWQYMILDEAQNIKNSSSVRWKTLLGFHCRNRLLLTGTPIQNSMQELWALLHFIMPSLFDSHDEFNEWFSKDIENVAENKGSKLNEHQLRRLHMILKPFMLRRVKRHVQNELSDKIEKDIYVDLSTRQRKLYRALLANVSISDLLEKAANISDADSARSLMNLVMQFRKVCNHPELFERADVIAPFAFSCFGQSGPLAREGDFISLPYSTRNPIKFSVPVLFYQDGGLLDIPSENSGGLFPGGSLSRSLDIWSPDWIQRSLERRNSAFSFLRLLDMSPSDAHRLHVAPLIRRRLLAAEQEAKKAEETPYYSDPTFIAHSTTSWLCLSRLLSLRVNEESPNVCSIAQTAWTQSCLSRPGLKWFVPSALAPPIAIYCSDRTFLDRQAQVLDAPMESLAFYGLPARLQDSEETCRAYQAQLCGLSPIGLMGNSTPNQLPTSAMQVPDAKRLIYDSAKLARLDTLLQELKAGDHRILIYFQMTRMMDLMEEYLIYRQYKYLRLDGSSKLEDRRDMVIDWQTRSDIFVFLLSTRAGGLGINLTAADTVVFYDHDWNPSNDAQAMDRAHRLGQTRQVTVYRLITKGTIDERIVQLARVKRDVQDIVVGNKNFTDVTKPSEIVQLLLNDDQLVDLSSTTPRLSEKASNAPTGTGNSEKEFVRDFWNDEGDDFFGHVATVGSSAATDAAEDEKAAGPSVVHGKRRKAGTPAATRGRKPGLKNTSGQNSEVVKGNGTPDEI